LHEQDYTYPDVMITADPRDLEDHYIKRYPSVIFEVISKSSRVTDSVDKFIRYRNIASLQNYVLVDSEKMFVEVRVKNEDGEWRSFIYLSLDDEVHIPAVNASFKLEALYENITFAG
jgi:Uma2 family endonuclease